jgi:hypothetical protein
MFASAHGILHSRFHRDGTAVKTAGSPHIKVIRPIGLKVPLSGASPN